jgi:hypothetical protein
MTRTGLARASNVSALYTVSLTAAFCVGGVLTDNAKARGRVVGGEALVDGLVVFEVLKLATQRQRLTDGDMDNSSTAAIPSRPVTPWRPLLWLRYCSRVRRHKVR